MRADPDFEALVTDVALAKRARAYAQAQIQAGHEAREQADREIKEAERALQAYVEGRVEQQAALPKG